MRVLLAHRVRLGCFVLGSALAIGLSITTDAHPRITTALSWRADIHPILERRCGGCHRTGGIAPMSFSDYETARPWARAIREEVLERRMPPSAMRSGAGLYENARLLSTAELELLAAWVDGGAPSGTEPSALVPAAPEPEVARGPAIDWDRTIEGTLTRGEAPLSARVRFDVPAGWIGAWMLDMGSLPVRAAHLSIGDDVALGTWTPDEPPTRYPDGAGVHVTRPAIVIADLTLTAAIDESEASEVKPRLSIAAPAQARRRVVTRIVHEGSTEVGAGDRLLALRLELKDEEASADVVLARASGEQVFLMAMSPPGSPDPITYRLRTPIVLQAGDAIRVDSDARFELAIETSQTEPAASSGRRTP